MLKKLFGMAKDEEPKAPDAAADAPEPEEAAQEQELAAPPLPDRPWLSIGFNLADLDSAIGVRQFAESLLDRQQNPDTIYSDPGDCDDGLITLLVHKKIAKQALPPMDAEAQQVLDRLMEEVSPKLEQGDYIAIACEVDGAIRQLVVLAGDDGPVTQSHLVRDGEVVDETAETSAENAETGV